MKTIARKRYLDTLSVLKDKNLIKVATGVRRCGKSTLMTQFQDLLRKENDGKVSILAINMDMPEFRILAEKNWKEIYDYIIKHLKKNVTNYVFIDEVQNVPEFEKMLEGLYVHPNIDLYVTGSNAFLLSSELATLLTGRAYEINVLPFSFVEYLAFTGKQHLATQEKYYLVDLGFRNALLGKELASDVGHLLENIIYLELKRRNNHVWIGKTNNLEVDFVVRNNEGFTQYIQVSQTVENDTTLEPELAPFDSIADHHEKLLITMDYETGTYNGIKKINAIDWLTKTEK